MREPECTVDMVPALADNSLLSGGKLADAGCVSICDRSEVNLYDGQSVKINVSEEAVLKGSICTNIKLWRIPLQTHVTNLTTQTLLLNVPTGVASKNQRYVVPNTTAFLDHVNLFTQEPAYPQQTDTINNVYELPSIGRAVRYLYATAGYPNQGNLDQIHT